MVTTGRSGCKCLSAALSKTWLALLWLMLAAAYTIAATIAYALHPPNVIMVLLFSTGWVSGCATTILLFCCCGAEVCGVRASPGVQPGTAPTQTEQVLQDASVGSTRAPAVIYITPKGDCYHNKPYKCAGLNAAGTKRESRTPCKFCYGGRD